MNDLVQFVEALFYSEFSQTYFESFKCDCVIKTIEIFNFLPLINNFVTVEFSFLLLIISAIISSKTINILFFILIVFINIFVNILHII